MGQQKKMSQYTVGDMVKVKVNGHTYSRRIVDIVRRSGNIRYKLKGFLKAFASNEFI